MSPCGKFELLWAPKSMEWFVEDQAFLLYDHIDHQSSCVLPLTFNSCSSFFSLFVRVCLQSLSKVLKTLHSPYSWICARFFFTERRRRKLAAAAAAHWTPHPDFRLSHKWKSNRGGGVTQKYLSHFSLAFLVWRSPSTHSSGWQCNR